MPDNDGNQEFRIFAAIQAWLNARVAPRWHGYIWFGLLAFAGLGFTAAVAYAIRLILGLGQ